MINQLHAHIHRPESGWDPVPEDHAAKYAAGEWLGVRQDRIDALEALVGGFAGKTVLDLGGGPGQYSVAFAMRGADVTWYDISRRYMEFTRKKSAEFNVESRITFSLGYLDDAYRLLNRQFDFVFNRLCWYYCISDNSFARVIYNLICDGGFAYIDANNSQFSRDNQPVGVRLRTFVNDSYSYKIGHPFPPRGRIARLFLKFPLKKLTVDYESPENDRIFLQK